MVFYALSYGLKNDAMGLKLADRINGFIVCIKCYYVFHHHSSASSTDALDVDRLRPVNRLMCN